MAALGNFGTGHLRAKIIVPVVLVFLFRALMRPPIEPTPIRGAEETPVMTGKPFTPKQFAQWPVSPSHPYMAPPGKANIHADAECSDAHEKGPVGKNLKMVTRSGSKWPGGMCATATFTNYNNLIVLCASVLGFELHLLAPKTLELLAVYTLPQRPSTAAAIMTLDPQRMMQDTSGGAYYYLDHDDFVILADADQQIQRIGHRLTSDGKWEFYTAHRFDLSSYVKSDCMSWFNWFPTPGNCDPITAVTADYSGNIWFATRHGLLGVVNPNTGRVQTMTLGDGSEEVQNGLTSSSDGVYVVTTAALYRLQAKTDSQGNSLPFVVWKSEYDRGTSQKVGMLSQGSGTAPTVFGDFVTINDNSDDQVNLNIYRRGSQQEGKINDPAQLVCSTPLFQKGSSASDNSMIAVGNTIIMENNFGYTNALQQSAFDKSTIPGGIQRVDIDPKTGTCTTVWTSTERAPSCVAKIAVETGLAYYYTVDNEHVDESSDDSVAQWYLTAIDVENGETVWKLPTGTGRSMDNNWGPITLGPDGTAYVGVLGGLLAIYDE